MMFAWGLLIGYFMGIAVESYVQRYMKEYEKRHGGEE